VDSDHIENRGYDRGPGHDFGRADGARVPDPPAGVTIVNWITPAMIWTRLVLFKPFDIVKWLALGFCAWLATLGQKGFNFNLNIPSGRGSGNPFGDVEAWMRNNADLVIAIVVTLVLLGIALALLVTWLSSRGRFMFVDNIVHNRAEVKQPWREYREQGNSLFFFRVFFWMASALTLLLLGGASALMIVPGVRNGSLEAVAIVGIVFAVVAFILWLVTVTVVSFILEDFVLPIMYVRRCRCTEAWREFRAVFAGHSSTLILYFLFKIVLGFVVGLLAGTIACLLCCIAVLPYIGTVLMLPFLVFGKSYSLYFMQQFHPDYRLLPLNPRPSDPMPESRELR